MRNRGRGWRVGRRRKKREKEGREMGQASRGIGQMSRTIGIKAAQKL